MSAANSPSVERRSLRKWFKAMGPGLITGTAGDDPAGIGTYSQVGAQSGTSLLWLMLLSTPMLQVVQLTCAKFGMVTKKGLGEIIREQYGIKVAVFVALLTCFANIVTIGADIAGISAGLELLTNIKWIWFVIPIAAAIWYAQVYLNYNQIRRVLLVIAASMSAYILAGILAKPDWGQVLHDTFIPKVRFDLGFFTATVGLLGTTISPYMYFFQTASELEERRTVKKLDEATVDVTTGMIYTNLISYFIIIAAAYTLHAKGITDVDTAQKAAAALEPVAGRFAYYLFAGGIIAAGLIAVPVLSASTATMVGEVVGWRVGMTQRPERGRGFYTALGGSLFIGVLILMFGINPVKALFWSQVAAGVVAPVLLFFVFRLASKREVLGDYTNSRWQQAWGWFTVGIMAVSAVLMFYGLLTHKS